MNPNFKRRLLAGLFVPALGLAVGTALADGTPSKTTGAAATTTSQGSASSGATRDLNPNSANPKGNPSTISYDAQTFDRLDKNRDGKISREEAEADPMLKSEWSKLDAAKTGSVNREDFEKYGRTLNPNSANPKVNPSAGDAPVKK